MDKSLNGVTVRVVQGDITRLKVDAIVNAANTDLQLGGGVAGAIRKAGGDVIQQECNEIGGTALGTAVITTGGNLSAKHVIHAVGPRYGIDPEPEKNLYNAVTSALETAKDNGLTSIALPAISTGIYNYPVKEAAEIILKAVFDFSGGNPGPVLTIVLCLFTAEDTELFERVLNVCC